MFFIWTILNIEKQYILIKLKQQLDINYIEQYIHVFAKPSFYMTELFLQQL